MNPQALLVFSRALRSLGTPLVAFLLVSAPALSGNVMHPLSFCNVLFVGNVCAAIVVAIRFGLRPIWQDWVSLGHRVRFGLVLNGCLSVFISALIFSGLSETTVTNTVLLGRLGPVIYAIAGAYWFHQRLKPIEWFGFSLIAVGVLAIVLKGNSFQINGGELRIMLSTVIYGVSAIISKSLLTQAASLRVVIFSRNLVSALVFFVIALNIFGPEHFGDVFSGQLWILMSIYALVIIVISQFAWFAALKQLDAPTVARWTVLTPVFGILYAFLLNGERPSSLQVIAFIVIMSGVLIANTEKRSPKGMPDSTENCLAAS